MDIVQLKDVRAVADIIHVYPEKVCNESTALIIDNGSFKNFI